MMVIFFSVFIRGIILTSLLSTVGGCSDLSYDSSTETAEGDRSGFIAKVSGAVSGESQGPVL